MLWGLAVLFCLFYVSVTVLRAPQDSNWRQLLSAFATFFCVCFGVASSFSLTRIHRKARLCVWRYVEFAFLFTRASRNSTMQSGTTKATRQLQIISHIQNYHNPNPTQEKLLGSNSTRATAATTDKNVYDSSASVYTQAFDNIFLYYIKWSNYNTPFGSPKKL
jgi:hypothetical protein